MSQQTFNVSPYFDDFDPKKNFHKILFKPARPVQTRELNQLQSIFQNQIAQFADNIFKNGSVVTNGRCSLQAKSYVRLADLTTDTSGPVDVEQFTAGMLLVGQTSGITATLVKGVNTPTYDVATIYVVYTGTGIDGTTTTFIPGENILFKDSNNITVLNVAVRCPGCPGSSDLITIAPTGSGSIFTIDDGVFYYNGLFLNVNRQDIVVSRFGENIAYKIGLDFVQSIVTYEDDPTLLDPSLGYPNSTAPGGDRYKADLILTLRTDDNNDGDDFILLAKVNGDGTTTYLLSESSYNVIMDEIAKRTYETNGNFTVHPFKVSFMESLKDDSSGARGWSEDGDADDAIALVTPSTAYVAGYRVQTIADTPVLLPKARDVKQIPGFINRFAERTYITLKPSNGTTYPNGSGDLSTIGNNTVIIYNGPIVGTAATGSVIGSFQVSDAQLVSGDATAHTAVFKYYIYNLQISVSGAKFSDGKSFYCSDTNFLAGAVVDANTGNLELYSANNTSLLYALSKGNVKSLRSIANSLNGSIDITVRKKLSATLDNAGHASFNSASNEFWDSFGNQMVAWTTLSGVNTSVTLTGGNTSVDPTTLSVTLGAPFAGQKLSMIVNVIQTNQKEKTKTITTASKTTSTAPSNTIGETILLAHTDGFDILNVSIYDYTNPSSPVLVLDDTKNWALFNGQTDTAYTEASVKRTAVAVVAANANYRTTVSFRYFAHSGTQGWFDIDSYATVLADMTAGIRYEDLPIYMSTTKVAYPLASTWDFRPDVIGSSPVITAYPPANASTAIFDISYYLARTDLLQIDKNGVLYLKAGIPADAPVPPVADKDSMALYEIWLKPYTYTLNDIAAKYIENKRYTMRDIGSLESRIENLEYYTALNLLEQSAASMAVTDDTGTNRFKNGFIADNFADFQAADLTNLEFRAGVDRTQGQLRPSFKSRNANLIPNKTASSGVKWIGKVAIAPYSEQEQQNQPYATKSLSINPYFQYNQRGKMLLTPNSDVWTDDTVLPAVTTTIDAGVQAYQDLASAAGVLGTDWGSWIDQNKTILTSTATTTAPVQGPASAIAAAAFIPYTNQSFPQQPGPTTSGSGLATTTNTTTTTTTNQSRSGTFTTVGTTATTYDLGSSVKDVTIVPYMRKTAVQFYASGLKPNTIVYAFFDGVAVSANCRLINFTLSSANAAQLSAAVAYGSQLITDSNGDISGEFLIPAATFFTGQKTFSLTTDVNNTGDPDEELTSASAVFFAGGLNQAVQDSTLQVITPVLQTTQLGQTQTVVSSQTTSTTTVARVPPPATPKVPPKPPTLNQCPPSVKPDQFGALEDCMPDKKDAVDNCVARHAQINSFITAASCSCTQYPGGWYCSDPIAQAFLVQSDCFATSLYVYFDVVDPVGGNIFVDIREMVNGYPGPNVLAHQVYAPGDVIADTTSNTPFKVIFDIPVYLKGNTTYCFVIGGYSPNTRAWVADLGQTVVNNPSQTVQAPPIGQSSFRSMNGSTWNATQNEYIKFNLFTAQFDTTPMNLVFENDAHATYDAPLDPNPFETQSGSTLCRVYLRDHGFTENDKVSFSLMNDLPLTIIATGLPPQVSQTITTATGSAVIASVTPTSSSSQYIITVQDSVGKFVTGQPWSAAATTLSLRDPSLLAVIGSKNASSYTLNAASGTFVSNSWDGRFTAGKLAGINVDVYNQQFSVTTVDSQDTFIIDLGQPATQSGRVGGTAGLVSFDYNQRYDVFNVSGTYLTYGGSESWNYTGVGHGTAESPFASDNYQAMDTINFPIGADIHLAQPFKIASAQNEAIQFAGTRKSISIAVTFNGTLALSPVINTDTFSVTTVANRAEFISTADFNQIPNASGRFVVETDPINGSETYKYVTQNVVLANAANDLTIFVDVCKDVNADFDVYVKRQAPYQNLDMDTVPWLLASAGVTKVNSVDSNDFHEYKIQCSDTVTGWNDLSDNPIPFTQFKIKIVGRTKNSSKPPLFKSFRGIAVT